MDHTGNRNILKSLNEQRALATAELDAVCTDLDVMLVELVAEVHRYLGDFIFENVLRDIRKKSSQAGNWPPHKLDALHADLDAIVDKEIDRITDALRNNEEWYDTDVVFLEKGTQIWKTVHSIDAPVNSTAADSKPLLWIPGTSIFNAAACSPRTARASTWYTDA